MKKGLALFLTMLLVISTSTLCFAAQPTSLSRVEGNASTPIIGQRIDQFSVTSAHPDQYTAAVKSIYYWVASPGGGQTRYQPPAEETFRAGTQYFCLVTFQTADGYAMTANTACVIPGRSNVRIVSSGGSNSVTYEFSFLAQDAQPGAPQANGDCVYCGGSHSGFFGFFVQLIHNILYALFGAKKR